MLKFEVTNSVPAVLILDRLLDLLCTSYVGDSAHKTGVQRTNGPSHLSKILRLLLILSSPRCIGAIGLSYAIIRPALRNTAPKCLGGYSATRAQRVIFIARGPIRRASLWVVRSQGVGDRGRSQPQLTPRHLFCTVTRVDVPGFSQLSSPISNSPKAPHTTNSLWTPLNMVASPAAITRAEFTKLLNQYPALLDDISDSKGGMSGLYCDIPSCFISAGGDAASERIMQA